MPDTRPRNIATIKEIIVERKVIVRPGRIKLNALLYSGFEKSYPRVINRLQKSQ